MLREYIEYFLTPAAPAVKALGYVREAISIESRYRRCHAAWREHLENCQQQIVSATSGLKPGNHVVILGSGALHDVPVQKLLDQGLSLSLVDIVHLPAVKRRYCGHPEIRFLTMDVTGKVAGIHAGDGEGKGAPPVLDLPEPADLVVSLNLLSQLPLLPEKCLEKKGRAVPSGFAEQVMQDHLDWLKHFRCPVLLISDRRRLYFDRENILESEQAMPQGISAQLGKTDRDWLWHIAPPGELDRNIEVRHNVGCWFLKNSAGAVA